MFTSRLPVRIAARRVATLVSKRATPRVLATRPFSTEKVPEEDYYDGHLMADRLEYLDDMLEKTLEMEGSLDKLKDTYAKKRDAVASNKSKEELEALFAEAATQKDVMAAQIQHLKALLTNAQAITAVDAPDGTSDNELQDGLKEVEQIIDYEAEHPEIIEQVNKHHELEDAVRKERARDPEHDW